MPEWAQIAVVMAAVAGASGWLTVHWIRRRRSPCHGCATPCAGKTLGMSACENTGIRSSALAIVRDPPASD
ncbi:MAG: hypothetical protein ACPG77_01145 [Nannocystaceae bacterium]